MSAPHGILVRVDTVDREGERQDVEEIVITLEESTIDVRLNDDDDTIAMLDLDEVEEAIKTLKRWR